MVGPQPVAAVTHHRSPGPEPGEAELGPGRAEVVADPALVVEELGGDDRADGVAAPVLRSGAAASVPVEAGDGVGATRLQLAPEHVAFGHPRSIACHDRRRPKAAGAQPQ